MAEMFLVHITGLTVSWHLASGTRIWSRSEKPRSQVLPVCQEERGCDHPSSLAWGRLQWPLREEPLLLGFAPGKDDAVPPDAPGRSALRSMALSPTKTTRRSEQCLFPAPKFLGQPCQPPRPKATVSWKRCWPAPCPSGESMGSLFSGGE